MTNRAPSPDEIDRLKSEIERIRTLDLAGLRLQWRNVFAKRAPKALPRALLIKALAYRIQADALGDLDAQVLRVLEGFADRHTLSARRQPAEGRSGAASPSPSPRIKPGSVLVREWAGRLHRVTAQESGFDWEGKTYRSLSEGLFRRIFHARCLAYNAAMTNPFRYFNSSPEVIRLAVMMYVRYPLSLRNVEDLLAERGIDVSHETIRFWWNRFGPIFAAEIRKKRISQMDGYPRWRWHLDEVFVKVNGELCYLWRAVDHEGEVLDAVVTAKRDKAAALRFLKGVMKRYGRPHKVVTDGFQAYRAAMKEIGVIDRHDVAHRGNNRAENSHQPFRRRERAMQRFRNRKTLQKFCSVHAQVLNHFNQERHLVS